MASARPPRRGIPLPVPATSAEQRPGAGHIEQTSLLLHPFHDPPDAENRVERGLQCFRSGTDDGVGITPVRAGAVWQGIALHTTLGIPEWRAPEIALVTAGVETDGPVDSDKVRS